MPHPPPSTPPPDADAKPKTPRHTANDPAPPSRDKLLLFSFSLVLLVGLAVVTFINPYFTAQQWFTYTCILGLAAGGFAAFLPGALEWQVPPQLRATGAIALVILVIFLGSKVEGVEIQARNWSLIPPADPDAPNPDDAAVYVNLNDHVVMVAPGTRTPAFKVDSPEVGKEITIERGSGGIVVHVPRAMAGQRLFMFVEDQDKWWISKEVLVPPTDRLELRATTLESLKRRMP